MLIALIIIIFLICLFNTVLALKNYKSNDYELAMFNMFSVGFSMAALIICIYKLIFN